MYTKEPNLCNLNLIVYDGILLAHFDTVSCIEMSPRSEISILGKRPFKSIHFKDPDGVGAMEKDGRPDYSI